MRLPPGLKIRNTAHGSGDRGMAFYMHEDTAGLGIVMTARRETGRAPFIETWRFRWLPDQQFATIAELARALEPLSPEDIAAEKARWPRLGNVRVLDAETPNRCMRHRDRHGVIQASVQTCWIPSVGLIASLCEECRPAATGNGQGVVEILEERRRQVAAMKKSPLQTILEGGKP